MRSHQRPQAVKVNGALMSMTDKHRFSPAPGNVSKEVIRNERNNAIKFYVKTFRILKFIYLLSLTGICMLYAILKDFLASVLWLNVTNHF